MLAMKRERERSELELDMDEKALRLGWGRESTEVSGS